MVTSCIPTQRATTWLCLAVALLVALMPVPGAMVCLGQDGHVGFGAATVAGSCPCEHDSATEADPVAALVKNDDRHPPCYDIALDLPGVLEVPRFAQKPSKLADTPPDDHPPAIAVWMIDGSWLDKQGWPHRPGATPPAARPRQQLQQRGITEDIAYEPIGPPCWVSVHLPRRDAKQRAFIGDRLGQRVRLTFRKPISGPLRLGHSSSFGLGFFRPVQEADLP